MVCKQPVPLGFSLPQLIAICVTVSPFLKQTIVSREAGGGENIFDMSTVALSLLWMS